MLYACDLTIWPLIGGHVGCLCFFTGLSNLASRHFAHIFLYLWCLFFFVNLLQAIVTREEGTSVEELQDSDRLLCLGDSFFDE